MMKQVAAGVWLHESECLQTNAVLVDGDAGVLLIDAGMTGADMETIAGHLSASGQPVVAGFSTHPHWDHLLWHPDLGAAPRYGTAGCAAAIQAFLSNPQWRDDIVEELPPEVIGQVPLDLLGLITGLPAAATRIPWDGPEVRILEHRAHAAGHAALLIGEHRVLVAGDMLSDVLIPMFDLSAADPIEDYLAALRLLADATTDIDVLIPGHGAACGVDDALARIDLDRAYVLAAREGRVPDDPRIGPSARPGWEWVSDVHAGQFQRLADRR